jgi:DNA-binding XRE family transcriptional regulator
MKLRQLAKSIPVEDVTDWELEEKEYYDPEEVSPELIWNSGGVALRGGRAKEELTQKKLAELTGIAQHHLSEMENGKRPIGKETAKKLGKALNLDYRVFL